MEGPMQMLPMYLRDFSESDVAYAKVRTKIFDKIKDKKYSWTPVDAVAPDKCLFVLIEPRDHANTEFVLKVASEFFSKLGHGLFIVHGCTNGDFMKTVACKDIENVGFLELPGVDNLPIPAYNALLMSKNFWRSLPHENIVVFQTDVIFLHSGADLLADFVNNYDYIGAPWWNMDPFTGMLCCPENASKVSGRIMDHSYVCETGPDCIGNGGLSYRKKSAMIEAIETCKGTIGTKNEDVFFAVAMKRLEKRLPKRSKAMEFSIEMCLPPDLPSDRAWSLGIHRMWAYHPADIVERALMSCEILRD